MPATGTADAANVKGKEPVRRFEMTGVVTMDGQAAGMTAGAGQTVELERLNKRIIKIWSNRVVFIDEKGYHNLAGNESLSFVVE